MAATLVRGCADSVALVAGGTSGVGLASAIGFADAGVRRIEAKRNGVRVNALTPSLIANTPTAEMVLRDGFSRKLFEKAACAAWGSKSRPRGRPSAGPRPRTGSPRSGPGGR